MTMRPSHLTNILNGTGAQASSRQAGCSGANAHVAGMSEATARFGQRPSRLISSV
ncbi:hypothetical protein [Granulosicoccus antarcticus]|uniref:hypothetical protein n=1 Tax=Granulosicoccus antarcticus TaxID=437505 RepID=UPI0012FD97C8|nr:hypothetical protein [Granulosicoccus antarcticus]